MHGVPNMKIKKTKIDDMDDLISTIYQNAFFDCDEYDDGAPYIMHKAAPRSSPTVTSTVLKNRPLMGQTTQAPAPAKSRKPEISFKLVLNEKEQFVQTIADQNLDTRLIYDENIRFKYSNGVKTLEFITESTSTAYNMFFDDPDWIKMYEIQVCDHDKPIRMVKIKNVISVDSEETYDENNAIFKWVVEV